MGAGWWWCAGVRGVNRKTGFQPVREDGASGLSAHAKRNNSRLAHGPARAMGRRTAMSAPIRPQKMHTHGR